MYKSMFSIENDIRKTHCSCTKMAKKFRYIMAYGRKFLKCILTYLCSNEYNEINISHLDVQKRMFPIKNGINNMN